MSAAAQLVEIHDPTDPRLADYVALRDASLRRHVETAQGLFIAEGTKVITRAVAAGYRPRSFLLARRWLAGLEPLLRGQDAPVYVVNEELAEQVTGFHVHRGALASLHREARHDVADLLSRDRLVVCEDIVDHTNVGAILRNVAALGWDGVLVSPRAADPLYRRSIKVSMGAVFSLPWARLPDAGPTGWHEIVATLADHGFTTVALTLADDAVDLSRLGPELAGQRVALLVGTEGAGLSTRWTEQAAVRATITMHAGIDSLNVAAATAIACYALAR